MELLSLITKSIHLIHILIVPHKVAQNLVVCRKGNQEPVSCSLFATHFNYSLVEKAGYTNMTWKMHILELLALSFLIAVLLWCLVTSVDGNVWAAPIIVGKNLVVCVLKEWLMWAFFMCCWEQWKREERNLHWNSANESPSVPLKFLQPSSPLF